MGIVKYKQTRGRPRKVVIPASFEVLGHTIRVEMVSPEELADRYNEAHNLVKGQRAAAKPRDHVGLYDHSTHTISLSTIQEGPVLEQTFLHEKEHCILFSMGHDELSEDEGFVDLHAELEYQSQKSRKGRLN